MLWKLAGLLKSVSALVVITMALTAHSSLLHADPFFKHGINPCQFRPGVYVFKNIGANNDVLEIDISREQDVKGYYRQFQSGVPNAKEAPAELDIWIDRQTARISCLHDQMNIELSQPARTLSLHLQTDASGDNVTASGFYSMPSSAWRAYPRGLLYAGIALSAAATAYGYYQYGGALKRMASALPVTDFFSVLVGAQAGISFAEKRHLWSEQWAGFTRVPGLGQTLRNVGMQVLVPEITGLVLWWMTSAISAQSRYEFSASGFFMPAVNGTCRIPSGVYYGRWHEQAVGEVDMVIPVGLFSGGTVKPAPDSGNESARVSKTYLTERSRALWPWLSVLNQGELTAYHMAPSKMVCDGNHLIIDCRDRQLENSATLVLSYDEAEQAFFGFGLFMQGQNGSESFVGNSPLQFIMDDIELRQMASKVD